MELKKIKLPFKIKKSILALGSQTKNTVCFAQGNFAYLSPLHPDLSTPKGFSNFERIVKYFLKKRPKIIAYDLHLEYQSTKYALNLKPDTYHLIPIQHHHAHIASCMLENGLTNQRVIGAVFDGTGLGDNNRLWGAEFLRCDYKDFKRAAHLKEIPLLGSERAILEPVRIVFAWLYSIYKDKFFNLDLDLVKKMDKKKWRVLKNMYLSGFNSPLASSMGRLFDAVGSLVLGKSKVTWEAELAIELEKIAKDYKRQATSYKFKIIKDKDGYILDPLLMFKEIMGDLKDKEPQEKIAYRFHLTVAEMIRKMCSALRKENKINKVVLSGGVFQNNLLLRLTLDLLYKEVFRVFTHKKISCNDFGISLGQVAVANQMKPKLTERSERKFDG
jgi:hydrogenase maturation protein HypF